MKNCIIGVSAVLSTASVTFGQTVIMDQIGAEVGDGVFWQANPNGGFGFGPWQQGAGDAAYRLIVE